MAVTVTLVVTVRQNTSCAWEGRAWFVSPVQFVRNLTTRLSRFNSGEKAIPASRGCFRHQLLLPRPYLGLTKPLRLAGMSRALLKFNGGSVHDYATIADDSPRPSRASRARRAATSASIS